MKKKMKTKNLEKPYTIRLTPDEEGGYVATIQELSGCIAEGDSPEEAVANITRAADSWIDAAHHLGQKIPEPICLSDYSGKIALRVPRSIHKQAAELSLLEGVSTNQLLLTAISNYLGGKEVFDKMATSLSDKISQFLSFCLLPTNTSLVTDVVTNSIYTANANANTISPQILLINQLNNAPTEG